MTRPFPPLSPIAEVEPNSTHPPTKPFALPIAGAVRYTGGAISRTRYFELIKQHKIEARKVGRRTVIMVASLEAYIARQPSAARWHP